MLVSPRLYVVCRNEVRDNSSLSKRRAPPLDSLGSIPTPTIISPGQATEAGCDVRMKGEQLTMHDRDGKLLVKTTRSRNRLYKVCMRIKESMCLFSTTTSDSSRWHARLGHINLKTMKSMIQRELVVGVPQFVFEKKICGSCLLGKQSRQVFP